MHGLPLKIVISHGMIQFHHFSMVYFKKSQAKGKALSNSLTSYLTPWRRVLLEKLSHLVKKFPAFYGT